MIRPGRALFAAVAVVLAVAACDNPPGYLAEQGRRHRLVELGVAPFDSTGAHKLAGMSAVRRIEVERLDPTTLGADTLDGAYDVFRARCHACHEVPTPSSKPAYLWAATISRMKKNATDAGLMPMNPSDEAAILDFLDDHAAITSR